MVSGKLVRNQAFLRSPLSRYSIFDSALYRNRDAERLFPQEKAALHDLQTSTCESKML
jgi:hypothetical protein